MAKKGRKGGFFPPQNFEESVTDFLTMIKDPSKPWAGKVPGCSGAELGAIEAGLNAYVPLRQGFEQARLSYDSAKKAYTEAGQDLWKKFFSALEHARTYAKQDAVLRAGLTKYKRAYKKSAPPDRPAP